MASWQDIAGQLVKAGAPILGGAIGGPLGSLIGDAVGNVVANALGVESTPQAVATAMTSTDPTVLTAKLSAAEAEATAKWPALAQMAQAEAQFGAAQVQASSATQMAELLNGAWYQRAWRPFAMFVWTLTWPFQLIAVLHHAYTKDPQGLAGLSDLVYSLSVWNAGPAALAGIYSWGRTREKLNGAVSPGLKAAVKGR